MVRIPPLRSLRKRRIAHRAAAFRALPVFGIPVRMYIDADDGSVPRRGGRSHAACGRRRRVRSDNIGHEHRDCPSTSAARASAVPRRRPSDSGRYADRFEVSLVHAGLLCGLGIGRPSTRHQQLGVDFIRGAWGQHPLKGQVTRSVVATAEEYGRRIGAKELRLYRPDPALVTMYGARGFRHMPEKVLGRGDFMVRGIS